MSHEYDPDETQLVQVGAQFAELARVLQAGSGPQVDPERLVQVALKALPHADHCSVTVLRPQRPPSTIAATGDVPRRVDDLQYTLGEGPCLDAAVDDHATLATDLRSETRWPSFARRCVAETGVHGILGLRLVLGGADHAALNLYSCEAGRLDAQDVAVASIFAPFAALAVESILRQQDVTNLRDALTSSRQIGTAVGIIMSRELLSAEDAFAVLRRTSQELNRKLRDIAVEVAMTGAVPRGPRADDPGDGAPEDGAC